MPGLPSYLLVLVAISGMSGLIYEMLWIRALGLHFGTSTPAVTTVVSTFMAGLGLGNLLLGPRADRVRRPLVLYRWIEVGIAVSGLSVSLLCLRGGTWLDALARSITGFGATSTLARASALALLMVVPCTLMGGTLPVLSSALIRQGHAGRGLGLLYACNTAGALLGALLPDFYTIRAYGLTATACVAVAGNVLVAAAIGRLAGVQEPRALARPTEAAPPSSDEGSLVGWWLTAISGFSAMALEVLWARTLSHWAGGVVTSFSLLLAVYLCALSIGAALLRGAADKSPRPLAAGAGLLVLAGIAALLPVAFASRWRVFELGLVPREPGVVRPGLAYGAAHALLHSLYLEGACCVLMGAAFPFVAASVVRERSAGTATGRLFTLNTIAGTGGALVAGFGLLPAFGEQGAYFFAVCVLTLSAAAGLFYVERGAPRWAPRGAAAAGVALVLVTLNAWPTDQLLRTHFQGRGAIVALREGSTTVAAATEGRAYGQLYFLELATPGVSMSETGFGARRYMGMMAHAAMLAARAPERALLICYGVGNTAASLLSYPKLARLDVVDVAQEVIDLAPVFARIRGNDPLRDPRAHVFIDDGRHHLIARDFDYDVITLEPPPPNHAGIVNLYSRDFYRLAKRRLRPFGVISQWLPVFELSTSDSLEMIAAFVAEFPHAVLLYGQSKHFVLLGSREPLAIDPLQGGREIAVLPTARNLEQCGIRGLANIYGAVLQDEAELRARVRGVTPLSDDRPTIEYPFAAVRALPDYARLFPHAASRPGALLATEPEPKLRAEIDRVALAVSRVLPVLHVSDTGSLERRELVTGNAVRSALAVLPEDEALLALLSLHRDRLQLAERVLAQAGARELLARGDDSAVAEGKAEAYQAAYDATWTLARSHFYAGRYAEALSYLDGFTPSRAHAARHALLRAGCLRALGRERDAVATFDTAAALSRDDVFRSHVRALIAKGAEGPASELGPLALH